MSVVLRAERVITGERELTDAWVHVDGARIVDVGEGAAPTGREERVGGWLIPGFVDVHVHGGGGGSFSNADVPMVAAFHLSHGTTTMLASLVSEPIDVLVDQILRLLPYVESGAVAGIHLEGPFLAERRCGAHDPRVLSSPDAHTIARLIEVGSGAIRMLTIAPELPGALDAIRVFTAHGIVAALGHSDADSALVLRAVDAGASQVTHLFNGMAPLHHRHEGLAEVGLLDERLLCELILDGHHLSDRITEVALRSLDERWIAITDAMAAAGLNDGNYVLGGLAVEARDGVVRLVDGGSLAGSTLTMDAAFRAITQRFHRTPLEAVQATATRPARVLNRPDLGVIAPGARANLLSWQDDALARVMLEGRWIP